MAEATSVIGSVFTQISPYYPRSLLGLHKHLRFPEKPYEHVPALIKI